MSYPKILRPRLHQAREIDELKKPLITNPKNSPVADKYVAAERKQKKSQIREYKKKSLSKLSKQNYLARYGVGIGSFRINAILNKSKITGQLKLFFYTYQTKDQNIGRVARKEKVIGKLGEDRINYSRAIPDSEFQPRHIGRDKPKLPAELQYQVNNINQLDGHEYKNKFLNRMHWEKSEEIPNYIQLADPNDDPELLKKLSGISNELNKKLKTKAEVEAEAKIKAGAKATNPRIPEKAPLATNYMLMLSFAIHSACKDEFNTTAGEEKDRISQETICGALDHLTKLPLLGSVLADKDRFHGTNSLEVKLAWRIAYKMAATPMGFDMLKKLNTAQSETHYTNPTSSSLPEGAIKEQIATAAAEVARQKRKNLRRDENIRLFMQGADAMLQEENPEKLGSTDPTSLLLFSKSKDRGRESRPNALLIHALPGLQRILEENEQDSAPEPKADSLDTVEVSLGGSKPHQPLWAANALRNGFFTDAGGSPFDKANQRLEKVALQVTRGLRNQNHAETEGDRQVLKLVEQKEVTPVLPRMFKRNRGKTPFNRSVKIDIAANSILLQREKMIAALRLLDKILLNKLPAGLADESGFNGDKFEGIKNNEFVLRKIAQIIYIRAAGTVNLSEILDGRALPNSIAKKLYTDEYLQDLMRLESISAADTESNFNKLKYYITKIVKTPLTPETLKGFFEDVDTANVSGIPPIDSDKNTAETNNIKDIPDLENIKSMSPKQCVDAFERAKNHLINGYDAKDKEIVLDPLLTRSVIAEYLNKQIQRMRLATSIKFSDGASAGGGIAGLTAVVARFFWGGVFGGRANFSYRRSRIATMEIGVSTASGFARFGTETNHINRIGAGASVGWSLAKFRNLTVGAGGYVDGKLINDPGSFTGVTLRLDRLGADITGREGQIPGVPGDANMMVDLGNVVEQVIMGRKTHGKLLEELLEETPHLSVCWVGEGDSTTRDQGHIVQGGALLGAFVKGVGVGSAATLARTRKYQKQEYEEQTGALRSRGIVEGERSSLSGQVTALGATNLATLSGQSILAKETVAIGELLGAESEIYRDGTREEIRTIEHHGELQPRSYKLIIHANAEGFASSVEPNLEEWAQRFVQVKEHKNYSYNDHDIASDPDIVERQLKATKEQAGVVRDLIQEMRETADPNTSYIEFLEIEEATTIQINRYRSMAKMAGLAGAAGNKDREILEEAAERLLKDPKSYVRRFLYSSTTRVADEGRQFNFLGSFSSTSSVAETVIRNGYSG
ncbi:hypothetical protein QN370_15045 [Actimicrobium sp. CCI2.3]|nr:hypothetical protein [Actimicrobium sp. CCI2.3]MEB0023104.1 hypothetical protein [Actimicrobium sp. CCI2.3]